MFLSFSQLSWLILTALATLVINTEAIIYTSTSSCSGSSTDDPLECYLNGLSLEFDDQCISVGIERVCLSKLNCNSFGLESIPSRYSDQQPTTLSVGVTELQLACSGDYSIGWLGLIRGSADIALSHLNASLDLFIGKGAPLDGEEGEHDYYPTSAALSSCNVTSLEVDVSFSSPVIDKVAPALLEEAVVQLVNELLCNQLQHFLQVNITDWMDDSLTPTLQQIVSSAPSPLPQYDSHYYNWGSSIVAKLRHLLANVDLSGISSVVDTIKCILSYGKVTTSYVDTTAPIAAEVSATTTAATAAESFRSVTQRKSSNAQSFDAARTFKQLLGVLSSTRTMGSSDRFSHSSGSVGEGHSSSSQSSNNAGVEFSLPVSVDSVLLLVDSPPGCNTSISVDSVRIRGLDSINNFALLQPLSSNNYTLHSSVGFDELRVIVDATVAVTAESGGFYEQSVELTLLVQNVSAVADVVVAFNSFVLQSRFVDQLASGNCWLDVIDALSFANLQLHLYDVVDFTIEQKKRGSAGRLEAEVAALIENAVRLVAVSAAGFQQLTADTINGLMQGPLRASLNAQIDAAISSSKVQKPCLTHYPFDDEHDYIVWANSSLLTSLDHLVNDLVGAGGANALFFCATNGTGSVSIDLGNFILGIGGLDSFYDLTLLEPTYSSKSVAAIAATAGTRAALKGSSSNYFYDLVTSIGVGYCVDYSNCNPLRLSLKYNSADEKARSRRNRRALSSSSSQLTHTIQDAVRHLDVELTLSNASLLLDTIVKLDRDVIKDTRLQQFGVSGCLAAALDDLTIEDVQLGVTNAALYWSGGERTADLTDLTTRLMDFITSSDKTDKTNGNIENRLSNAEVTCKNDGINPYANVDDADKGGHHSSDDDSNDDFDWWWQMLILVFAGVCSLVALLWAYHHYGRAKKLTCAPVMTLISCKDELDDELQAAAGENKEEESWRGSVYRDWGFENALICHNDVPLWLRIAFPLAVCGNIALFLDSNLTSDAVSVLLKIDYKDQSWDQGSIFDFGLGSTVQDMWDAEVYLLASLILFFSGCWPYIKLVMMLVSWIAPTKVLSLRWRETGLVVLDVLGKWSLIDFFVMILMLCAFYYNIYIAKDLEVHVTVRPRWGFYSFLLATMLSLALGHIALACHRLIVEPKMLPIPEHLSPKMSLSTFIYQIDLQVHKSTDRDSSESSDSNDDVMQADSAGASLQRSTAAGGAEKAVTVSATAEGAGDDTSDARLSSDAVNSSMIASRSYVSAIGTRPMGESNIRAHNIEAGHNSAATTTDSNTANSVVAPRDNLAAAQRLQCGNCGVEQVQEGAISMLVSVTPLGQLFVVASILTTAIFAIAGTFMVTMAFKFKGLVGLLLKDDAEVNYSLVDVGTSVPEHSGIPNDFAVRWLQGSFFVFGQAMPFATLLMLLLMWLVPLSIARQRTVLVLTEVLNAWSTLDVFCVAIAAALLEIQQFAKFIVGDSCDSVDKLLKKYADDILEGDDTCFDVVAELKSDSWVLFTAAVLMIVVALPILEMSKAAHHRRQSRIEQALLLYTSKQEMMETEELILQCQKKGLHVEHVTVKCGSSDQSDSASERTSAGATGEGEMHRVGSSRTTLAQYNDEQQPLLQPLLGEQQQPVRVGLADDVDAEEAKTNGDEYRSTLAAAAAIDERRFSTSRSQEGRSRSASSAASSAAAAVVAAAAEKPSSWLASFSYTNFVIAAVGVAARFGMVEVAYMFTADANDCYASKLTDDAAALAVDASSQWFCKWNRLSNRASADPSDTAATLSIVSNAAATTVTSNIIGSDGDALSLNHTMP